MQPFLHADEAKSSAFLCRFAIKSCAGVADRKMNLIRLSPQSRFDPPHPTVFRRIVEGFLQNTEEAKRNVRRQRAGQIVTSQVDLHVLPLAEFFAEASHGDSYA